MRPRRPEPLIAREQACDGCFVYERSGGVCPMARHAYGLESPAEARRRAEVLRAAVVQDSKTAVSLSELVRLGASHPRLAGLLLPSPIAEPIPTDSRKEAIRVAAPHTIQ